MLIVTAKDPLLRLYGSTGYAELRGALNAFAAESGGVVVAVDDSADMQAMGMEARSNSPSDVLLAIRGIGSHVPAVVNSILIIGGTTIIPFWSLPNPVNDRGTDPDTTVLTDNPYGALMDSTVEYLAPTRPVGRLPIPDSASLEQSLALVAGLTPGKNSTTNLEPGTALVVNEDWLGYSQRAAQTMPSPQTWHLVPGYELDQETRQDAARAALYFNLHGFSGDADWKGYSTTQRAFIPAVTPDGLDRSFVAGAISFAECCYGAQIAGRSPDNSCALKLVQEGASFIGATGLAFGSYIASDLILEDADFLARAFFAAWQAGASLGAALGTARSMYLNDATESQSGAMWECKQKTLLQFVLFGNPQTVP